MKRTLIEDLHGAVVSLKSQLARERVKSAGLRASLKLSKESRDAFAKRYWDLCKQVKAGAAAVAVLDSRYEASYKQVIRHVSTHLSTYHDGDLVYVYVDPVCKKPKHMAHPFVEWKVIRVGDQVDVVFNREIQLTD